MDIHEILNIRGNKEQIEKSTFVGCMECCNVMKLSDLELLSEMENFVAVPYACPHCQHGDCFIGDSLGIEITEKTLKEINQTLEDYRDRCYKEDHETEDNM